MRAIGGLDTEVDGFQFKVGLLVAIERAALGRRQRSFARVAVAAVDRDEDVGVRAAPELVARLNHDAVLHAAQSCASTYPAVCTGRC